MAKYDDGDGVWRTIGGRRVFIRTGQSLSSAMKESGKFKTKETNKKRSSYYKEIQNANTEDEMQRILREHDSVRTTTRDEATQFQKEWNEKIKEIRKKDLLEDEISKRIKENKNQKFNTKDEAFIKDLTEHYDEFTRGDLQGTIEAKYGMGEKGQAILKEIDDRTYEKYKVDTLNNDERIAKQIFNFYGYDKMDDYTINRILDEAEAKKLYHSKSDIEAMRRYLKNRKNKK